MDKNERKTEETEENGTEKQKGAERQKEKYQNNKGEENKHILVRMMYWMCRV